MDTEMIVGCHLSLSEGYAAMGRRIGELGGNTFQFFTKNPRGRAPNRPPEPEDVKDLAERMRRGEVILPVAHAPYTYNPCALKPEVREYTRDSMRAELTFLENLPGTLYNFHPGCHVGQGAEEGYRIVAGMLEQVLRPGMGTPVLLETMAGKGTELGRSFEELARIISMTDPGLRGYLGVTLDTCHIHDAGYDLTDFDGVLREFDGIIGLDRLRAVHLNDSANERGSRKDRHAKLGEGTIGAETLIRIAHHPLLRGVPKILETPNDEEGYAREIRMIRERETNEAEL